MNDYEDRSILIELALEEGLLQVEDLEMFATAVGVLQAVYMNLDPYQSLGLNELTDEQLTEVYCVLQGAAGGPDAILGPPLTDITRSNAREKMEEISKRSLSLMTDREIDPGEYLRNLGELLAKWRK